MELVINTRSDWSRVSELWTSLMEPMILFTCATITSTTAAVSVCSFWGASFRRMASVVERHWFMLSAEPRSNQL